MQPTAIDSVAQSVGLSLCWPWPWALQKQKNQSWCHLECCLLGWASGTMC